MEEEDSTNWMPLTAAARKLGIVQSKLSRLVKAGIIRSKRSVVDKRRLYVDFDQARALIEEESALWEKANKIDNS